MDADIRKAAEQTIDYVQNGNCIETVEKAISKHCVGMERMREMLSRVRQYAKDTLSGPSGCQETLEWHRHGWLFLATEMQAALDAMDEEE